MPLTEPSPITTESVFALTDVTVEFGGITALSDVSLSVGSGEILGVIGPNGAGKTTLFNVACGLVRPQVGSVVRSGESISRLRPKDLPRLGMSRTLQGLGLFDRMTVLDNVMVGADHLSTTGVVSALLGLRSAGRDTAALRDRALAVLVELGIDGHASRYPPSLPYAVRKKVALARALVSEPTLLLLDEPASGLSDAEMGDLAETMRSLTTRMSILLVEHHMDLVMSVCDHLVVLDFGKVIARGTPDRVRRDPAVLAAYLGDEVDREG
ncbi:ABC transporter ATP-binding protein [Rhodococcoides corynebacterioides]|uniref:ABC transporter ATP-binding protein n=1 Tax=Rhodococcoides corynebacterioides TaxID=53972 RepID=UPI0027E12A33|nr:ABC transporter ATP-binding protein [Rhodococcus corynebacterioides]